MTVWVLIFYSYTITIGNVYKDRDLCFQTAFGLEKSLAKGWGGNPDIVVSCKAVELIGD